MSVIVINPHQFGTPLYAQPFSDVISYLGLTSGLELCLDAGDSASYSSGQKWLDTSGNGYDFFRGSTSASESSDPTFNGTPGGLSSSEYWSFDGGDWFTYDSSNETWMENLHKDSAAFTWVFWVYLGDIPSVGGDQTLVATRSAASETGILLFLDNAADLMILNVFDNGATVFSDGYSDLDDPTADTWLFYALSVDEAAGTNGFLARLNGSQETASGTYASPDTGGADDPLTIGATDAGLITLSNGSRMAMVAAWSTPLTHAQILNIYTATKGRYQ